MLKCLVWHVTGVLLCEAKQQVLIESLSEVESGYASFMSDGFVTLVGSDKKVQVRILRDLGALNTFVRKAILPFSPDSDMGCCVPVRGIGPQTISVPEH